MKTGARISGILIACGRIFGVFLVVAVCVTGLNAQTSPQTCTNAIGQSISAPGFQCTLGDLTFFPYFQNPLFPPVLITSALVRQDGAVELDLSPQPHAAVPST